MSQQQRLIGLPLMSAILLSLLVGLYLFASKRFSKSAPATTITRHTVETPPQDALKYWTADKMRSAKPAPMPQVDKLDGGKRRSRRSPRPSKRHQD